MYVSVTPLPIDTIHDITGAIPKSGNIQLGSGISYERLAPYTVSLA